MPIVKVAKVSEIRLGEKRSFRASKTRVLVANIDGKFYAVQSVCTHHSNPLFDSKLIGNVLWCSAHYAKFDMTTGEVVSGPEGSDYLKIDRLKTYPVSIDGSDILVEVPE